MSSQWAHREFTVSSRWPKWSQPAVAEPWPGPWLSYDLAVTKSWSYWRCRDWAVTSPWLSCDLAVTELWPRRDWAVTSLSRDCAVIIGPGAVTFVVTVSSRCAHSELTGSSRWHLFFSWVDRDVTKIKKTFSCFCFFSFSGGGVSAGTRTHLQDVRWRAAYLKPCSIRVQY